MSASKLQLASKNKLNLRSSIQFEWGGNAIHYTVGACFFQAPHAY